MTRVCAKSALVVDMTSPGCGFVRIGATIGVDGSSRRGRRVLVEGSHVRILLELRFEVGHVGGGVWCAVVVSVLTSFQYL